jgi:hypothetical protein
VPPRGGNKYPPLCLICQALSDLATSDGCLGTTSRLIANPLGYIPNATLSAAKPTIPIDRRRSGTTSTTAWPDSQRKCIQPHREVHSLAHSHQSMLSRSVLIRALYQTTPVLQRIRYVSFLLSFMFVTGAELARVESRVGEDSLNLDSRPLPAPSCRNPTLIQYGGYIT